ncbi:MAG: type II toxin-antitoxin system YoeB family toxin [Oscillospiraceae bacterium]|nr:type II toxin-antitoxin system YoeB family toxin [Oscillospiraceae bacterium]
MNIGKPEPLRHEFQEFRSRRIDDVNRPVYKIEDGNIVILHCRGHYE